MKLHIELFMESKDPEAVKLLKEFADNIKNGEVQRDFSRISDKKACRVKATVEVKE